METKAPLVETLLPIRQSLTADETGNTYEITSQTVVSFADSQSLLNEVRASDGGTPTIKLIDKGID